MALVVNGQLFASLNAILRIHDDFLPDFGCPCVLAAAFGHQRQFALRLRPNFGGQTNRQCLCAGPLRPASFSSALQKS
jgi:hypothetical protein